MRYILSRGEANCENIYTRFPPHLYTTFVLFFPIWKVPKSQRVSELFALKFSQSFWSNQTRKGSFGGSSHVYCTRRCARGDRFSACRLSENVMHIPCLLHTALRGSSREVAALGCNWTRAKSSKKNVFGEAHANNLELINKYDLKYISYFIRYSLLRSWTVRKKYLASKPYYVRTKVSVYFFLSFVYGRVESFMIS